tara:strand:- start:9478 stop:9933 length:456 start_codon:yes stop_codon:yes gene_type:complete
MKKKIILDLDHALIYSTYKEIVGLKLISKRKYLFLYHRPLLNEFLKYVENKYDIIFYTSSKIDYARWVVSTFKLDKNHEIFGRKYTQTIYSEYGITYKKSLKKIEKEFNYKINVLDDRPDLWDEYGVKLIDIKPWMGEHYDKELKIAKGFL